MDTDKKYIKYLTNKSSTISYLFSCCDIIELAQKKIEEMPYYEDTGLDKYEKDLLTDIGYRLYELKSNVASLAVRLSDEIEHDITNMK